MFHSYNEIHEGRYTIICNIQNLTALISNKLKSKKVGLLQAKPGNCIQNDGAKSERDISTSQDKQWQKLRQ